MDDLPEDGATRDRPPPAVPAPVTAGAVSVGPEGRADMRAPIAHVATIAVVVAAISVVVGVVAIRRRAMRALPRSKAPHDHRNPSWRHDGHDPWRSTVNYRPCSSTRTRRGGRRRAPRRWPTAYSVAPSVAWEKAPAAINSVPVTVGPRSSVVVHADVARAGGACYLLCRRECKRSLHGGCSGHSGSAGRAGSGTEALG